MLISFDAYYKSYVLLYYISFWDQFISVIVGSAVAKVFSWCFEGHWFDSGWDRLRPLCNVSTVKNSSIQIVAMWLMPIWQSLLASSGVWLFISIYRCTGSEKGWQIGMSFLHAKGISLCPLRTSLWYPERAQRPVAHLATGICRGRLVWVTQYEGPHATNQSWEAMNCYSQLMSWPLFFIRNGGLLKRPEPPTPTKN